MNQRWPCSQGPQAATQLVTFPQSEDTEALLCSENGIRAVYELWLTLTQNLRSVCGFTERSPGAGKTWSWWHSKGARAPHEATDPEMSSGLFQRTASGGVPCLHPPGWGETNVCPICLKRLPCATPSPGCRDTRARLDHRHSIAPRCHQFMPGGLSTPLGLVCVGKDGRSPPCLHRNLQQRTALAEGLSQWNTPCQEQVMGWSGDRWNLSPQRHHTHKMPSLAF